MSDSPPSSQSAHRLVLWSRLAIPMVILSTEALTLSLLVELDWGSTGIVPAAVLFKGLLFGLACYLILAGPGIESVARDWPEDGDTSTLGIALPVALHVGSFLALVALTLHLADAASTASPQPAVVALWHALCATVGLTACLLVASGRFLLGVVRRTWRWLAASVALGAALTILAPRFDRLWPAAHGPAVSLVGALLRWYPGGSLVAHSAEGLPIVGTPRMQLVVTPGCSELSALLGFWLLAAVVAWRFRGHTRALGLVTSVLVGSVLIYVVNAVRIYGLVLVGLRYGPQQAVALAHSRLWAIGFLALSGLVLCASTAFGRLRRAPRVSVPS